MTEITNISNKKYKLTGYFIDTEVFFDTEAEAQAMMEVWIAEDIKAGIYNSKWDYYIMEVDEYEVA